MKGVCSFYFDSDKVEPLKKELEDFLKDEQGMNTLEFSKKVMRSQEIKTNNNIEGYLDDVLLIEDVIRNSDNIKDSDKINRIINLYKGYKYILEGSSINKENLRELYKILSKDLLCDYDIKNMGDFYRNDDVFIYFSDNVQVPPDKGVDSFLLEDLMGNYFEYLNKNNDLDTMTDYYVKSQIAHFYFVYLHPYFDINGRTARTTSMWYLLNNEAYPYIIFNRAIGNSKNVYYKEIKNAKTRHNLTNFISYLMVKVKEELEKEYVIQAIKGSTTWKLNSRDFTTILDILSMKGLKTLKDFTSFYNLKNDKKSVNYVYDEMLFSLLDKGIIKKVRDTKSMYNGDSNNFVFRFDSSKLDLDRSKIRRLKID